MYTITIRSWDVSAPFAPFTTPSAGAIPLGAVNEPSLSQTAIQTASQTIHSSRQVIYIQVADIHVDISDSVDGSEIRRTTWDVENPVNTDINYLLTG